MSSNTPVETKPAAHVVAAPALAEPAATAAAKAKPWMIGFKQKYWLAGGVACGLVLAAGVSGYKYFTTAPGKVVAQTEAPPPPPAKSAEPTKLPPIADVLPPVIVSPIRTVKDETPVPDINVPDIKLPIEPAKVKPAPNPATSDTSGPPPILPPDGEKTDTAPLIILTPGDKKDKTEDPFKATGPVLDEGSTKIKAPPIPAPLPTDVRDRKENKPGGPVLTIGGLDPTPPAKKEEPIPPPPPVPGATGTKKDDPIVPLPPPIPDVRPITVPNPKKDDPKVPAVPAIPDVSPIAPPPPVVSPKSPAIALPGVTLPDTGPAPMIPPTTIGDPLPPPPPIAPGPTPEEKKKGIYDEDWHSYRDGDTYPLISREYYKTADYAAALEAYNKERRKSKDDVIRVPPPWVLEEQFPNLLNKPEKTAVPEPKATGSIKFEPVAPAPGTRPAPAPLSRSNDEYRVINEAGETIREIARKVYGNENAWRKVFDQNPGIDPTQPIPSGTTLRVAK
jgi:hypothetical protein